MNATQARGSAPEPPVHARILIIGTGFSGLGMAIKLKQAGIEDFVLLERGADVGGTWRDNRYPGCACDVQSHLYSFSFEPNPGWSRMFAPQPEIWDYLRHCAGKYQIRPHIRFGRDVSSARFDESGAVWNIECANGEHYRCKLLICALGPLSRPAIPGIPGLADFAGPMFHSAQWPADLDLRGKRVAVIGTGASAIQFVPQIAREVGHLTLFQRTPPWILPRPDRRVSAAERWMFRHLPFTQRLFRGAIYLRMESRALGLVAFPGIMKLLERLARRHIRKSVADPELRARLTPDYAIGCKRVLLSDDYYPAFSRDNVRLVSKSITRVEPTAVRCADGEQIPADVLILGTGFQATSPVPRNMIFGRGGCDLAGAWEGGPEAYLGTTVSGFPNLFFLIGPNTGLGHNSMIYMIESQIKYVMDCLLTMQREGLGTVEVRGQVQADFNRDLQARLMESVWSSGCHSWYLHSSGKNTTLWPGFTFAFRRRTRHFDRQSYECQRAARVQVDK